MTEITRDELLAAARRHQRPGISSRQAFALAYAELVGSPLDPWSFDDAAVILRAESLMIEGLDVATAVETARAGVRDASRTGESLA